MFRLLPSGLPEDSFYPADLKSLGYFINEEDEIRSIENPRAYFNYFLTKNERVNDSQREAMHTVIRETVYDRLSGLGLQRVRLPLGVSEADPHVPIFVSSDISEKKRVIILFYEHNQDLGVLAIRIIGGRGGINQGSAVNMVKYIQSLRSADTGSPGIILANLGQLRWWRRGKKAVTQMSWFALPQKSAVHSPFRFDVVRNTVPENRTTEEHTTYVLRTVTAELCDPKAMFSIIGVSDGAMQVVSCLNKVENWEVLGPRLEAIAMLAPYYSVSDLENKKFVEWLRKRGRVYLKSSKEKGTALYGTSSTKNLYGCPVYSLGEPHYNELLLPKGYQSVIDWFCDVSKAGEQYNNPNVIVEEEECDIAETVWTEVKVESEEKMEKEILRFEGDASVEQGTAGKNEGNTDVHDETTENQAEGENAGRKNKTKCEDELSHEACGDARGSPEHEASLLPDGETQAPAIPLPAGREPSVQNDEQTP